jgi:hypothetical protein
VDTLSAENMRQQFQKRTASIGSRRTAGDSVLFILSEESEEYQQEAFRRVEHKQSVLLA